MSEMELTEGWTPEPADTEWNIETPEGLREALLEFFSRSPFATRVLTQGMNPKTEEVQVGDLPTWATFAAEVSWSKARLFEKVRELSDWEEVIGICDAKTEAWGQKLGLKKGAVEQSGWKIIMQEVTGRYSEKSEVRREDVRVLSVEDRKLLLELMGGKVVIDG